MERITDILKQYISERIPQTATNIFFQMFNGIQAMFQNLEYRLDIAKRESNLLTAQHKASLRNLAAMNGVQPTLRTSAKGLLMLKIDPKLYSRVGYPLFIKPYAVFRNKLSRIEYMYMGDKPIRMNSSTYYVPVVEGIIKEQKILGTGEEIQRVYLTDEYIAENSMIITANGEEFTLVNTFYENAGLNNNRQFIIRYSGDAQNPIIVYIRGLKVEEQAVLTYRLTNGEMGNIVGTLDFETEAISDSMGSYVTPADDEITIVNISGFSFGSNGTDENALRTCIGYNHGSTLLFDNTSYRNFLAKFSTILVQDVKIDNKMKQINHLFLWRKNSINETANAEDIKHQYQEIVDKQYYKLTEQENIELSKIIEENEYCMSSHVLNPPKTNKFALQIMFDSTEEMEDFKNELTKIIYTEFSKFFYIRNHYINMEVLFDDFKQSHNCNFDYIIFNELIENKKIVSKQPQDTQYIIYHLFDGDKNYVLRSQLGSKSYIQSEDGPYLPILKGDFNIADSKYKTYQLTEDINFVVRPK